jgi:hypothetical protein
MAENKKAIIVYADWIDVFEELTDEEAGMLIKHFFRYVNDKNPIAPNRVVEISFIPIKNTLKRDLEKWNVKIEGRSKAGIASAEARRRIKEDSTNSTNVEYVDETPTNPTDSVSDSVSVSVSDILLKKVTKGFVKPTISEIKEYCFLRYNNINPETFYDFYESKGWMVGKNKMKDWKAAVRTWEKSKTNKEINNGTDEKKIGRQSVTTIQANANPDKWFEPEGN